MKNIQKVYLRIPGLGFTIVEPCYDTEAFPPDTEGVPSRPKEIGCRGCMSQLWYCMTHFQTCIERFGTLHHTSKPIK